VVLFSVFARPRVILGEAPERAGQLHEHRRHEKHADEDVQREERSDSKNGHALDGEQHEQHERG